MTTVIKDSYSFNAKLKSKGQQRNNDGWTITVDWRLPGSQYDLVLYGKDWDDLGSLEVGDFTGVMISKGNLKQEKDGRYASDYFWDLEGFDAPGPDNQPANPALTKEFEGKPLPEAAQAPQRGSQQPPSDDIQTRIQVGQATNIAAEWLTKTTVSLNDRFPIEALRNLRDCIYHEVMLVPVAPAHYCHEHQSTRRPGAKTGAWVHLIDGKKQMPCFDVRPPVEECLDDSQEMEGEQQETS